MTSNGLTRRSLLTGLVGGVALAALPRAAHACQGECCASASRWSDSGFKDGADVVVTGPVLLDRDVRVRTLTIAASGILIFDPSRSVTLTSFGNVVIRGVLRAAPRSATQVHKLAFLGVKEAAFVGGGMDVIASDVGLWVAGAGRLELQGAERTPWVRLVAALRAGDRTLTLAAPVQGWQVGDELVIAPTASPTVTDHSQQYDTVRISAVSGRTVTVDRPMAHAHPVLELLPGLVLGAEVMNMTRNVQVGGTAAGRSHVWVSSTRTQVVEYVEIRHVGPRRADGKYTKDVLGRYGLHLHMQRDASRGTQVLGTVVRDSGSHAFVPHLSHGVRFAGCISHNTYEEPYWYDPADRHATDVARDVRYEGCVASQVRTDPWFRGYRLAGFYLGSGVGNEVRGCVAVGVQGNKDAAGFTWPEGGEGTWGFADNVSHNNKVHGSFTWQNAKLPHIVHRLVAYHNGGAGMSHGAYTNFYDYRDCILIGNQGSGVVLHAQSGLAQLTFTGLRIDARGLSDHAVSSTKHTLQGSNPVLFRDCSFTGYRRAAVGLTYDGSNGASAPEALDLVRCAMTGNELWFADATVRGGVVRLQAVDGQAWAVRPKGDTGTYTAKWNARQVRIGTFDSSAVRVPVPPVVTPKALPPRTLMAACPDNATSVGARSSQHAGPSGTSTRVAARKTFANQHVHGQ